MWNSNTPYFAQATSKDMTSRWPQPRFLFLYVVNWFFFKPKFRKTCLKCLEFFSVVNLSFCSLSNSQWNNTVWFSSCFSGNLCGPDLPTSRPGLHLTDILACWNFLAPWCFSGPYTSTCQVDPNKAADRTPALWRLDCPNKHPLLGASRSCPCFPIIARKMLCTLKQLVLELGVKKSKVESNT